MSDPHRVVRRKSRMDEDAREAMWNERAVKRHLLISQANAELGSDATFEAVSVRTGIPLGYLRNRFRTLADLHAIR